MRKAVLVGINNYPSSPLAGCENDVARLTPLLRRNHDGSPNFECRLVLSSGGSVTKDRLRKGINELFAKPADTALFYFSGHGSQTKTGGVLVTEDYSSNDLGISMEEVVSLAGEANGRIREIFILLDCCHSGFAGKTWVSSSVDVLPKGVSILTASSENESAIEIAGEGVFTSLVCEALDGGAADVLGKVTAAGVYSFLDTALGAFDQRPHFKANLTKLELLRQCEPALALDTFRKMVDIFPTADHILPLTPEYEPTADPQDEAKQQIFSTLQKFRAARLVVPVDEEHLYFAAMHHKGCQLTPRGKYYWSLVKEGRI